MQQALMYLTQHGVSRRSLFISTKAGFMPGQSLSFADAAACCTQPRCVLVSQFVSCAVKGGSHWHTAAAPWRHASVETALVALLLCICPAADDLTEHSMLSLSIGPCR